MYQVSYARYQVSSYLRPLRSELNYWKVPKYYDQEFRYWVAKTLWYRLKPKTAGGWGFSKNISSKERVLLDPGFFVTFNIIICHIFLENFIEVPQIAQRVCIISSIFWTFRHFLVTKKLMTSAYNRWCLHVFTFKIL